MLALGDTSQIKCSLISQSKRKQRIQIIAYSESCPSSGNSNLPPRYKETTLGKKIMLCADTEELGFEIIIQQNETINDLLHILTWYNTPHIVNCIN